jgi:nucleoside diphosphate kinase
VVEATLKHIIKVVAANAIRDAFAKYIFKLDIHSSDCAESAIQE